jgi:outer membrane protein TolC
MSELNVKAARLELQLSIKNAYYTVLMAKLNMETAQRSYSNVLKNKEILEQKFRLGRAPKGDMIKMASDLSARIPTLKEATANYELSKNYLKLLLGIDDIQDLMLVDKLDSDFQEYDQEKLLEQLKNNHPTLQILRKSIGINKDLIDIRKADFLPVLAGYGSYIYTGQNEKVAFDSDTMSSVGVVGIKLSIPIFSGGEKSGKLEQALIDRNSSELQYDKVLKALQLQLKNSLTNYLASIDTYRSNLETIRLTRQTYTMTQDRFMAGTAALTELNDMERALSGTELMASATLYKINQLKATIEMLTSAGDK